jgi:predicted exporter
VFTLWAVIATVIGVLTAKATFSPDLRGMLPANDPAFVREMDFYARQGATRVLALEASGDLQAAKAVLTRALTELAPLGVKPLEAGGAAAVVRAGEIIRAHLPALATPDLLAEIEPQLEPAALDGYLKAFKERALRPDDNFTASAARRDLLALTGRLMQPLVQGLGGSERDGHFMRHADGHLLIALEVPFDPQTMSRTEPLMAVVDRLMAEAKTQGVTLEAIGSYRHFRDNLTAVYSDLSSSMPLAIVLIGLVLFSLIPNLRALAALHIPALLGMAGGVAAVTALGLDVPLPLLGFAAGMLGVAVDYGQHVIAAIRAGEGAAIWRPLTITWVTTASAFAVLVTSAVPGIRVVGIMIIAGLGIALLAAIFLLPRMTPRLREHDHWLVISRPLLGACQRRPWVNWTLTALITTALAPGLWQLGFNDNLKSYDGSRPETWKALEQFLARWGSLSSSDYLVAQDAELGTALDRVAAARDHIAYPPSVIERLMPGPSAQTRNIAAWNAFWEKHAATFSENLAVAAKANGLRAQAFTESLALYRPATVVPPVTITSWEGSAVEKLVGSYLSKLDDGAWQVASPVMKLTAPEVERIHMALGDRAADAPVWLACREHIGHTLISVVADDLTSRSLACVLVVLLVVSLIERNARAVLAQLLPPAAALIWTFGLLGWMGIKLDPFAVLAAAFIGGIGIDSAVFLTHSPNARTLSPVLVASITTIVGMLSLLSAQHPTIYTLGRTLLIGMSCCLVACLLITPAIARSPAEKPSA